MYLKDRIINVDIINTNNIKPYATSFPKVWFSLLINVLMRLLHHSVSNHRDMELQPESPPALTPCLVGQNLLNVH